MRYFKQRQKKQHWMRYCSAENDGGTGAGAGAGIEGGTGAGANANSPGATGEGDGTNANHLNPFMAKASVNNNGDAGGGENSNAGNGGSASSSGTQQTPDIAAHMKALNLTQGVDTRALADVMSGAAEGEVHEALGTAFETIAGNAYKAAMGSLNNVLKTEMPALVEEAVGKARGGMQGDMAFTQLTQAEGMAHLGNEQFKPVAKAILAKFVDQHNGDTDRAVTDTVAYFKQMSGAPAGGTKNDPLAMNGGQQNQSGEATDWLDLFGTSG